MRGLVIQSVEQVEFHDDLPEPELQEPHDVIVAVHRAGICGSDLHQYHGRERVARGTIPGHEFVGEIVAAGEAVTRFQPGDRVFGPFTVSCGQCFFCRDGLSARCEHWQVFGYRPPEDQPDDGRGLPGAQAELLRVPRADTTLLRLPSELSCEKALLLGDNFTTGFFCAEQGMIRADGVTVVIGCGAVGLSTIASARFLGAETIVAVDPVPSRREHAAALGAVAVSPDRAVETVRSLPHGQSRHGADSVLEAVGLPAAQRLAFELVRPGGVISAVGMHTADRFAFSPADAYNRNVTYRAGRCSVRSYLDRLVPELLSGALAIPVEQIVTQAHVPLDHGPDAYRRFADHSGNCVKLLLDPHAA